MTIRIQFCCVNSSDATKGIELTNLDWTKYVILHIVHRIVFKHILSLQHRISLGYCVCYKHTHIKRLSVWQIGM